jgi:hypothetical protein
LVDGLNLVQKPYRPDKLLLRTIRDRLDRDR